MRTWRVLWLGIATVVAGGVLFVFDPAVWAFFPRCPIHTLTGLYCPGCGTQRALHLLLHGDVYDALRHNPLVVLGLPVLVYAAVLHVRTSVGRSVSIPARPRWLWALGAVVLAFLVLRNVPAFAFLAPPS